MKIIIAGTGEVGFHLSKLLAQESHDIVIIDHDKRALPPLPARFDNLPSPNPSSHPFKTRLVQIVGESSSSTRVPGLCLYPY